MAKDLMVYHIGLSTEGADVIEAALRDVDPDDYGPAGKKIIYDVLDHIEEQRPAKKTTKKKKVKK